VNRLPYRRRGDNTLRLIERGVTRTLEGGSSLTWTGSDEEARRRRVVAHLDRKLDRDLGGKP
jgi:hypothetical protein